MTTESANGRGERDDDVREQVCAASKGDIRATEFVLRHFSPLIYAHLVPRLPSREAIEDVFQEVCTAVLLNIRTLRNPSAVSAWIIRITRTAIAAYYRKNSGKSTTPLDLIDTEENFQSKSQDLRDFRTEEVVQGKEIVGLIIDSIASLDDKYRVPVYLLLVEELTSREIGEMLALRPSTTRMRIKRGLAKLRKLLAAKGLR